MAELKGTMFDLDSMSEGGGLWGAGDGVDNVIDKMWVQPWRHSGDKDYGIKCAVAIHYTPLEDGVPEYTDYVSIGDIKEWAPSNDGKTPIALPDNLHEITAKPEDAAGYSAPRIAYIGERSDGTFNRGSKWAQWYKAAKDAGVPPPTSDSLADFVRGGIRNHASRIAQKGAKANDKGRIPDILVITRFDGFGGGGTGASTGAGAGVVTPGAVAGTPNAGQSVTANGDGDFGDMNTITLELVATAGGTLAKKDLLPQLLSRFAGQPENVKRAVKFANSLPALSTIPGITFDPAAQTFTLG